MRRFGKYVAPSVECAEEQTRKFEKEYYDLSESIEDFKKGNKAIEKEGIEIYKMLREAEEEYYELEVQDPNFKSQLIDTESLKRAQAKDRLRQKGHTGFISNEP